IVMTTHGRGLLSRFWLGSVADQLLRRSPIPLLLLRPTEKTKEALEPSPAPDLRQILVPLDGWPLAEQILPQETELGRLNTAELTLLRVVVPPSTRGYDPAAIIVTGHDRPLLEQMQTEAWAYVERMADRLRGKGLQVESRVLIDPQPAVAILDVAGVRAT